MISIFGMLKIRELLAVRKMERAILDSMGYNVARPIDRRYSPEEPVNTLGRHFLEEHAVRITTYIDKNGDPQHRTEILPVRFPIYDTRDLPF